MASKFKSFVYLVKNNFTLNPKHLFFLLRHALTQLLLNIEVKKQFQSVYGNFNWDRDCRSHRLMNPTSEGGAILGDVVLLAKTTKVTNSNILLAGDRNEVKDIWKPLFPEATFTTAGVHEMDHLWNYENDPPQDLKNKRFSLIISQATLEHLLNPYKHVEDLASLLEEGGCLVVHSVLPGFFYHRVPIDCMRFYPDWFEEIAKRLNLQVIEKQISVFNITYKFQK